ncbi:MAG TPA: hypothetical protein VN493_23665 [Thermoanaerobaculia bacterium]|nr:hypothetical protein [Thermoanaerobaculia bacterium]
MSTNDDDLSTRLGSLPKEAEPARDLWPGIEARILDGRTVIPARRRASALLRLAAALLIFVSGLAVGHVWGRNAATSDSAARRHPLAAAEEVQRTGTEYVAAVAALREETRSEVRTQGREAAFSTLYGAAHELARQSPNDADASQLLNSASRARGRSIRF